MVPPVDGVTNEVDILAGGTTATVVTVRGDEYGRDLGDFRDDREPADIGDDSVIFSSVSG